MSITENQVLGSSDPQAAGGQHEHDQQRRRGTSRRVSRSNSSDAKQLVYDILTKVVDHPDGVHVNVIPGSYRMLIELHTDPADVGQVIGRQGTVISSIRTLLAALGGKHKIRCELEYVTESENDEKHRK